MSEVLGLKTKLGLNVFKENKDFHISIKEGHARDPRLLRAMRVCPAGLYTQNADGVELSVDGCLECGACLLACGEDVLSWHYPNSGAGVQFRFG